MATFLGSTFGLTINVSTKTGSIDNNQKNFDWETKKGNKLLSQQQIFTISPEAFFCRGWEWGGFFPQVTEEFGSLQKKNFLV
jgi:hypothetical protein